MKVLHTAFLPILLCCTNGFVLADRNVERAFEEAEIKPDILDKAPKELIRVKFEDKFADLGNELTPTEVKDVPEIHYKNKRSALYTLIMSDPDAPSRETPTLREWHHWHVGNIPGDDISKGEVLAEYVGSAPPNGTGLHRYVFLVYKQPGKIKFDEELLTSTTAVGRDGFSTREFAAKYNLGDPLAGNLYQAQYDDYVPILHAQLGLEF